MDSCGDEEALVDGNADALLSVISNLLSNAIRYTPPGGRVTLHCESTGDDQIAVAVSDSGIGMSSEVRGEIFERFYRAPEARAWEAGGLGLGLALAHQRVLAHGGRIEVESQPDVGSTFRVLLPLSRKQDEEDEDGDWTAVRRPRARMTGRVHRAAADDD